MTGFRGRRGRGGRGRGRFTNGAAAKRMEKLEVYKGEHVHDYPATIALIEIGSALRQPRHKFTFKDETMTLQYQERTLKVHGCADYDEGKRVASDLMLKQIYSNHPLTTSTQTFNDSHEFEVNTDSWKEGLIKYNANREEKRQEFLDQISANEELDEATKASKIATYQKNYAVQSMPEYDALCKNYLARRKKRLARDAHKRERMSDGEGTSDSSGKEVDDEGESPRGQDQGSDHEVDTDDSEGDEDDPDRDAYRRIVEMLADVSRVQNIPYPVYDFKYVDDTSVLTLAFQTTLITMKKGRAVHVNMRGVISDLMLKDLYEEHEIMPTTQEHIEACEKTANSADWDAKVAKCRKDNEERVREKMALLEERQDRMPEEVRAEIRARYELWLEEREQPAYDELCRRVDERLERIEAKRANRRKAGFGGPRGRGRGRGARGGRGFRGGNKRGIRGGFRGGRYRGKKVDKTEVKNED